MKFGKVKIVGYVWDKCGVNAKIELEGGLSFELSKESFEQLRLAQGAELEVVDFMPEVFIYKGKTHVITLEYI